MKRSHALAVSVALATLVAAVFAATASPAGGGSSLPSTAKSTGVLHVGFAVQRFVKRGTHLVAVGRTISTVTAAASAISFVNASLQNVDNALATLGTSSNALDTHLIG